MAYKIFVHRFDGITYTDQYLWETQGGSIKSNPCFLSKKPKYYNTFLEPTLLCSISCASITLTRLLHSGEIPPEVLCSALEPSTHERQGAVGAGLEEGPGNDQRAGTPFLWEQTGRVRVVQPGKDSRKTWLQPFSS